MSAAQHFRLGLFILGALAALIAVLVAMGTGNLLRPTIAMETYIDGSVQGLDVGAPIKFRGVTIGEVTRLGFTAVEYEADVAPVNRMRYVMVEGRLRPDRFTATTREVLLGGEVLEPLIRNGLRVRMAAQGITGINYLELDFLDPAAHPVLPIHWEPRATYIPSAPSIAMQFLEYAESVLRRIDRLDIEGVIDGSTRLMATLDRTVSGFDTELLTRQAAGVAEQMERTAVQVQQTLAAVSGILDDPLSRQLPAEALATLRALRDTIDRVDVAGVIDRIDDMVGRLDRGLGVNEDRLAAALVDLQAASSSLRSLTEDARRNPGGTIFGSPPPRSALERGQ